MTVIKHHHHHHHHRLPPPPYQPSLTVWPTSTAWHSAWPRRGGQITAKDAGYSRHHFAWSCCEYWRPLTTRPGWKGTGPEDLRAMTAQKVDRWTRKWMPLHAGSRAGSWNVTREGGGLGVGVGVDWVGEEPVVSSSFDGYSPPDNNDTFPEKTCGSSWQMPCHASIGLGSLEVEAKGRFIVRDHVLFILFRSILYITVECSAFCKL